MRAKVGVVAMDLVGVAVDEGWFIWDLGTFGAFGTFGD